jgi:3-oxoacyl-[acyl-carrier protein] reductase
MNKVFLVTGATKGIGLAISQRLISHGHQVIGVARKLDSLFPGLFYPIDLSDSEGTQQGFSQIAQDHSVSGIVNNVGIALPQP